MDQDKSAKNSGLLTHPMIFHKILEMGYNGDARVIRPPQGPHSAAVCLSPITESKSRESVLAFWQGRNAQVPPGNSPSPLSFNKYKVLDKIKPNKPVSFDDMVPLAIAKRIKNGKRTPPPTESAVGFQPSPPRFAPSPPSAAEKPTYKTGRPRHRALAAAREILERDTPSPPYRAPAPLCMIPTKTTQAERMLKPPSKLRIMPEPSTSTSFDDMVPPAILKRINEGTKTPTPPSPSDPWPQPPLTKSNPKKLVRKARITTAVPRRAAIPQNDRVESCSAKPTKIPVSLPKHNSNKVPVSHDDTVPPAIMKRINEGTRTPPPASPSEPRPRSRSAIPVQKKQLKDRVRLATSVGMREPTPSTSDRDVKPMMAVKPSPRKSKIPVPVPGMRERAAAQHDSACAPASSWSRSYGKRPSKIPVPTRNKKRSRTQLSPIMKAIPEAEPILFTQEVCPLAELNWIAAEEPKFHDERIPPAILKRMQNGTKTPVPMDDAYAYSKPTPKTSASKPKKAPKVKAKGKKVKEPAKLTKVINTCQAIPRVLVINRNIMQELIFNRWYGDIKEAQPVPVSDINNNLGAQNKSEIPGRIVARTDEPCFRHYTNFPTHQDYQEMWFDPTREIARLRTQLAA